MNRKIILSLFIGFELLLLVGSGLAAGLVTVPPAKQLWVDAAPFPTPSPSTTAPLPPPLISMSAVGDIAMGDAPERMPANDGRDFFDEVKHLFPADLVMGNIEEPITDDTGYVNCRPEQTRCFQYRIPPHYASHLRAAGFDLLNQANNHGHDYGPTGYRNTQRHLEAAGIKHTGAKGLITMLEIKGVKVAVLGFSSYPRDNSLVNLTEAKAVVEKAAAQADIVVIQVHWGAEGSDRTHVKPGTETFVGENRGDPIKFSHTVIDAGADLIIGHGPHTLRAIEIYKGRLIAYSLGNFAGGTVLRGDGNLGWGGVLKVTLEADGTFFTGHFASTYFNSQPGVPHPDPQNRGLNLIRDLSRQDFPETGARFDVSGVISTL